MTWGLGINVVVLAYCTMSGLGIGLIVGFAGAVWCLDDDRNG